MPNLVGEQARSLDFRSDNSKVEAARRRVKIIKDT
jgi:hypothetical protein